MPSIVAFSDSHGSHRKIENLVPADILICAGDITWRGEPHIIQDFAEWMQSLNYRHKICIWGNHETFAGWKINHEPEAIKMLEEAGITLLHNSSIVIDGVKFWGSPHSMRFGNWAFMLQPGEEAVKAWSVIPSDVNVIVHHGPPFGILDGIQRDSYVIENVGSRELRKRIRELPKLTTSIFGHIHSGHGSTEIDGVKYYNVAVCDEEGHCVNPAQLIEI